MKIIKILNNNRCSLSFEVFPPKASTSFEQVKPAIEKIAQLKPAFMSVTYGAGGGTSRYTLDIAQDIRNRYGVPTMAHLTCVSSTKETIAEKINEQLNLLEEAYISGTGNEGGRNHLLESATDNFVYIYETGADLNKVFTSARTVRSMRADGSVVSFRFWTSVYTGGESGKHSYFGISYDTQTGEKLTLDSLSPDPEAFKKALVENLIALVREDIILSDEMSQAGIDAESALTAVVREGNWYFDTDGIVVFPAFGELRAEDKGLPMFTVPYSALEDLMYERYLPVKREGAGSLEIVRVGDVQDGTVASIDRLVLSDEGEEMYLKVDGTVYDLRISSMYYVDQAEGDERFYETDLHWYASYMSDCALQLSAVVPNGMPDLMITYTDRDNVLQRRFLSESGVDGGITLVDNTIEAVG